MGDAQPRKATRVPTRRGCGAAAVAVFLCAQFFWGARALCAGSPSIPITFTTNISMSERIPLLGGPTVRSKLTDQNMTLNGRLPGFNTAGQQVGMSFNQSRSRGGGASSTTTNLGLTLNMSGRNFSYNNNYSLVETKDNTAAAGGSKRNENLSLGAGINWPRMPTLRIGVNRFEADGNSAESNQISASHSLGKMNFNYTQFVSASKTQKTGEAETRTTSISVTRQHFSEPRISISTALNLNSMSSATDGVTTTRNRNQTFSMSVLDSHVKNLPLTLNVNFQKNNQLLPGPGGSQSTRSLNAFTSNTLPGGITTSAAINLSSSRDGKGMKSNSKIMNVSASKSLNRKISTSYNYTQQQSGSSGANEVRSRNMQAAIIMTLTDGAAANVRIGKADQPSSPSSRFISIGVQNRLPFGITTDYQQLVTRSGATMKTESANLSVPLNRAVRMSFNTTKRRSATGADGTLGLTTTITVSPSMLVSATYSRQRSDGAPQSRVWSMNISTMLPQRVSLNLNLSVQNVKDFRNISTSASMTTMF